MGGSTEAFQRRAYAFGMNLMKMHWTERFRRLVMFYIESGQGECHIEFQLG